jgi:hypothetical protein
MVRVKTSNEYGALSEADLQQFETAHAIALPEDYRSFLMEHNGGRPIPSTISNPSENRTLARLPKDTEASPCHSSSHPQPQFIPATISPESSGMQKRWVVDPLLDL